MWLSVSQLCYHLLSRSRTLCKIPPPPPPHTKCVNYGITDIKNVNGKIRIKSTIQIKLPLDPSATHMSQVHLSLTQFTLIKRNAAIWSKYSYHKGLKIETEILLRTKQFSSEQKQDESTENVKHISLVAFVTFRISELYQYFVTSFLNASGGWRG